MIFKVILSFIALYLSLVIYSLFLSLYSIYDKRESATPEATFFSSVWCYSGLNNSKRCTFSNVCYSSNTSFIFILTNSSILSGLNSREDLTKLYATSVLGHTALPLKISLVSNKQLPEVQWYFEPVFLLHRFKPDNLMHVIHDDLLPLYTTYVDLCLGNVSYCTLFYNLFFSDDNIEGPFMKWYGAFSKKVPFQLSQLNSSVTICFSKLQLGLSVESLFYQYGFLKSKGAINFHPRTGTLINNFKTHILKYFKVASKERTKPKLVFITRHLNRKILNEEFVERAIQTTYGRDFNMSIDIFKTDFTEHSPEEILFAISESKYLLGMHGAGMFIAMFLPYNSIALELFPYGIKEENVSPLYAMSTIPDIQFSYFPWHNLNELHSFPHPEYPSHFGGLSHLSVSDQINILNATKSIPSYKCCSDVLFLSRMYQDTVVDESIFEFLRTAFNFKSKNLTVYDFYHNLWFYPSFVQNVSCIRNERNLFLNWFRPFNVHWVANLQYKVQIEGENDAVSLLITDTVLEYTLSTVSTVQVWIMCIINDIEGIDYYITC